MVHVRSAIFTELDLEGNAPIGTQPPDVLSSQQFGRGNSSAAAVNRDPFLEVEMDRVIPLSSGIDVGPVLDVPGLRIQELNPVGVHRVLLTVIDLDDPGKRRGGRTVGDALAITSARVAITVPPYDDPCSYRRDNWDLLGQDVRHDAGIRVG